MENKDFEVIADCIKHEAEGWKPESLPAKAISDLAFSMANYLKANYPNFNSDLFIKACMPK